jgi:hypothetical protein
MERQRALQIVLATIIVLIVLVISKPVCACSRQVSNDSAAVANLRTINTAEFTYQSSSGGSYGSIAELIEARFLDDTFTGIKSGYNYSITLDAAGRVYTAEAIPASAKMGRYGYYSVPDAVVRYSTNESLAPSGQSGRLVE